MLPAAVPGLSQTIREGQGVKGCKKVVQTGFSSFLIYTEEHVARVGLTKRGERPTTLRNVRECVSYGW